MKALLDAGGVLAGFSHAKTAKGVDVPDDCDLEPGKYVWDGKCFNPILAQFNSDGPAPDFSAAVIKALACIRDGSQFPPDVLSWLSAEEKALKLAGRW
jgi:hypothetical protein